MELAESQPSPSRISPEARPAARSPRAPFPSGLNTRLVIRFSHESFADGFGHGPGDDVASVGVEIILARLVVRRLARERRGRREDVVRAATAPAPR